MAIRILFCNMDLDEFFSKYGTPEEIGLEDYSDLIYDSYDLYKKCIKKYYITEDFDLDDLSYLYNDNYSIVDDVNIEDLSSYLHNNNCSTTEDSDLDDSSCLYKNN